MGAGAVEVGMNYSSGNVHVIGMIDKIRAKCLIDSGARISLVSSRIANILEQSYPTDTNNRFSLTGVTGAPVLTKNTFTEIPLQIGGQIFMVSLIEAPDLREDILLGEDFLFTNQVHLDFQNGTMNTHNMSTDLKSGWQKARKLQVRCINAETIESQSVIKCLTCDMTGKPIRCSGWYQLTPNPDLWGEDEDSGIVWYLQVNNGKCKVFCINDMKWPVYLPEGTKMATATPLVYCINNVTINTSGPPLTPNERWDKIVDATKVLEKDHLSSQQKEEFLQLLRKFQYAFALSR